MKREYVIINEAIYMKVDGRIVDFPDPIPPDIQSEVRAAWEEHDARGPAFISYHRPANAL